MAGAISKIITEYYELVDERNELKVENKKLKEALKEARDILVLTTLLDKSGQTERAINIVEIALKKG